MSSFAQSPPLLCATICPRQIHLIPLDVQRGVPSLGLQVEVGVPIFAQFTCLLLTILPVHTLVHCSSIIHAIHQPHHPGMNCRYFLLQTKLDASQKHTNLLANSLHAQGILSLRCQKGVSQCGSSAHLFLTAFRVPFHAGSSSHITITSQYLKFQKSLMIFSAPWVRRFRGNRCATSSLRVSLASWIGTSSSSSMCAEKPHSAACEGCPALFPQMHLARNGKCVTVCCSTTVTVEAPDASNVHSLSIHSAQCPRFFDELLFKVKTRIPCQLKSSFSAESPTSVWSPRIRTLSKSAWSWEAGQEFGFDSLSLSPTKPTLLAHGKPLGKLIVGLFSCQWQRPQARIETSRNQEKMRSTPMEAHWQRQMKGEETNGHIAQGSSTSQLHAMKN